MNRAALIRKLVCLAVVARFAVFSTHASDRISVLHVRVQDGEGQILDHLAAPGALKSQLPRGSFEFEILDVNQTVLFRGTGGENPWIEYPDEHDRIGTVAMPSLPAEFVIRFPWKEGATSARFRPRNLPGSGPNLLSDSGWTPVVLIPEPNRAVRAQSAMPAPKLATLLTSGPSANRLNIVILAEGFTSNQESLFNQRAQAVLDKFLNTQPYASFKAFFNGYTIFVASEESGSDHPSQNIFRSTYFNSSFESSGVDRLLTIPPNSFNSNFADGRGRVFALLADYLPEYDIAVVLVNDPAYGGSGGIPAVASLNSASPDIAVHEVGHSFAGLGDEYDTPFNAPDTEEPNTTRETRRAFIKWNDWILSSTPIPTPETAAFASVVGLFEGAHYQATGWYRPKLDCTMKTLGVPFCEICREALTLACFSRINLFESIEPSISSVTSSADAPLNFGFSSVSAGEPFTTFSWRVDNQPTGDSSSRSIDLGSFYASPGVHSIVLQANSQTPFVRTDRRGDLTDSFVWTVTVLSSPQPVLTGSLSPQSVQFESTLTANLILDYSTNLTRWDSIQTNLASRQIEFVPATPLSTGFFRARARPAF